MSEVQLLAETAVHLFVVLFMVTNLVAIGLEIDGKAALVPLRDLRFVAIVVMADWLLSPALALALTSLLPMGKPYAVGLLLIGLAPAAPFLPMMVRKAGGDTRYTAALMLISSIGTVAFMPPGVAFIVPGMSVDAWTVARPLIVLLFLPMAGGMTIRRLCARTADRLLRIVHPLAGGTTAMLLIAIVVGYLPGFVGAVGSCAIVAQLIYAAVLMSAGYLLSIGMPPQQRSVVSLGLCTRNLGAALAPLVLEETDPRTMVMIALGVPVTLMVTYMAAAWFYKRAAA
jgi:BASS family bile acid:Na+ symporter